MAAARLLLGAILARDAAGAAVREGGRWMVDKSVMLAWREWEALPRDWRRACPDEPAPVPAGASVGAGGGGAKAMDFRFGLV